MKRFFRLISLNFSFPTPLPFASRQKEHKENIVFWKSPFIRMAFFLGALVALSYLRYYFSNSLSLDTIPPNIPVEIFTRIILFIFMGGLAWAYLSFFSYSWKSQDLKKLFYYSLLINFLAFLCLPLTSNDIFSNLALGRMAHEGLNLDRLGPSALALADPFRALVSPRWINLPTVYGPIIGMLNVWATRSGKVWVSLWTFKVFYLFFSWATVYLVYRICRNQPKSQHPIFSFLLLGVNPLFIWEISSQAHNDGIMILALTGFVYLATLKKDWGAFFCLLCAFVAKMAALPILGLFLFYIFFQSKKRFFLMSSLLVLATFTFVFLFYHRLGLALVSPFTGGFEPLRISNSISYLIYWAFYPLGRSFQVGAFRFYWTLSSLFLGMMGFRFALRSKTLTKTFWYSCIFLLLLILVFSPNYQPWYLTWVLPFGVAIPDKRIRELLLSYSVLSIFTYPILCGPTAALLVIIFIGLLWKKLGSPLRTDEEQMTSLEIVTSET